MESVFRREEFVVIIEKSFDNTKVLRAENDGLI